MKSTHHQIDIAYTDAANLLDVRHPAWSATPVVSIERYWSGEPAPRSRRAEVRSLWSSDALFVLFDASQCEPIIASGDPTIDQKTLGLWDRDVCEVFIAPDASRPGSYFEFEAAPTGEWVDLAIEMTAEGRLTDTEYRSGMRCVARIESDRVLIGIMLPWDAFGMRPKPSDVWLGNLFRCVGEGPSRGYLAWRPTMTEKPNFHVPDVFGRFVFIR